MASASVFCFQAPDLTSLNDRLWCGYVSQVNPFLFQAAIGHGVYHKRKQTRTAWMGGTTLFNPS